MDRAQVARFFDGLDLTGKVAHMTVPPAGRSDLAEPYEVIHLGGEAAAIVPLAEGY